MNQHRNNRRRNGYLGCCCGCGVGAMSLIVGIIGICGILFFYMRANAPQPPLPDYTPNPAVAQQFENKIEQAASVASQTKQFNLSLTEDEVSAWLNLNAPQVLDSDIPLRNLQARFRNGQTSLYAEVDTGFGYVGTEIGIDYVITSDGQVRASVGDVQLGGIGLPDSLRTELNNQIQATIDQQLSTVSGSYRVTQIISSDGVLILTGNVTG